MVFKKTRIFGRQNRIAHELGCFAGSCWASPFLPEFADQNTIGGVNPQGDLWLIVKKRIDGG